VVEAVRRVVSDRDLRERLSRGGPAAARRNSWDHVTDLQEEIYRAIASRTAATKLSTDGL
jgi:glycosyltransferase involved in cell wall biosynthesis